MTTVTRTLSIPAPPEAIWRILSALDQFAEWESGYVLAEYASEQRAGVGTLRRAVLQSPIGPRRVTHRVTRWQQDQIIAWEARDTNFPFLKRAEQTIRLERDGGGTIVHNEIVYTLKYGLLGKLADAMMMKRTVEGAAEGFLECLAARATVYA